MKSPFKLLDAFTLKDKDSFFGRDQEIDSLYGSIFKTPLLLVYGLSGTGKTSLINCGLASQFDGPDWYPVFLRRNENINVSLDKAFHHILPDQATPNLAKNVALVRRETLRAVYLLFDQFEELFILGKEEEQTKFFLSLRELLDAQIPSRIVLIMREEYIAQLYKYENIIPELFDHRFRIEPMGHAKVKNVISSSFHNFNIHLADPKEELLETMILNISDPNAGITLPYLQVYLDMLYQDKYARLSDDQKAEEYPRIDITRDDINSIGKIDNVLERFLDDQTSREYEELIQKYKIVPPNCIQSVLDVFVSDEGTKRPVKFEESETGIKLTDDIAGTIGTIPPQIVTDILRGLQHKRILNRWDENFELAHDSLALIIHNRRSLEQRELQNIRKRFHNAYEEYRKTGAMLNQKQIDSFDNFRPQLGLTTGMEEFLRNCEEELVRKASEERNRLEQKIAEQKRQMRIRGIWLIFSGVLVAIIAGFAIWAFFARKTIERKNKVIVEKSVALENEKTGLNNQLISKDSLLKDFEKKEESISSILSQVQQQIVRIDSIDSGSLPRSELKNSILNLKSIVQTEFNIDTCYISVKEIRLSDKDSLPDQATKEGAVFNSDTIYFFLNLNTPSTEEEILLKCYSLNNENKVYSKYLQVNSGGMKTKLETVKMGINEPGPFVVEVHTGSGKVGSKSFRIKSPSTSLIKRLDSSNFIAMQSGDLTSPGMQTDTFLRGDKLRFWGRIFSPQAEVVYVQLVDKNGQNLWKKEFVTGINTDKGYRIYGYRTIFQQSGTYHLNLLNSQGELLVSKNIIIN